MLLGRLMQEMGIGLDALAAVAAAMRADVGGGDRQSGLGQDGDHMGVDPLHLLEGEEPLSHAGLVGYQEERKVLPQPLQGADRGGKEPHFVGAGQVAPIFDQCSIAVQEYGGPESLTLRQIHLPSSGRLLRRGGGAEPTLTTGRPGERQTLARRISPAAPVCASNCVRRRGGTLPPNWAR